MNFQTLKERIVEDVEKIVYKVSSFKRSNKKVDHHMFSYDDQPFLSRSISGGRSSHSIEGSRYKMISAGFT